MNNKDYYEILGVDEDASPDDIRREYRRLAKKYHPDANRNNRDAEARFKEISEAYDTLGDAQKRQQYDQMRNAAGDVGPTAEAFEELFRRTAGGAKPGGEGSRPGEEARGGGLHEWFSQLLRDHPGYGHAPRAGPQRGENLTEEIEISFEEALEGGKKTIAIKVHQECSTCGGSGAKPGTPTRPCPACGGQGKVALSQGGFSFTRPCDKCFGRGRIITAACATCRGRGEVRLEEKLLVSIPMGVEAGQKLRVVGRGRPGIAGGPAGDLILIVHIRDHELFSRQGNTIHSDLVLNVAQAILGTKVPVQTLSGMVEMAVPPGTQSGAKLRIKGCGPRLPNGGRGDHIIEVVVKIPRELTEEQKDAVRRLARELDLEDDSRPG